MIKIKYAMLILVGVIFVKCSPKVNQNVQSKYPSRSHLFYEAFAIYEIGELEEPNYEIIGEIEIKDSGFTLHCDYETVLELAKTKALTMGANAFVVTEHREPNNWSTCHRIKARALLVNDPRKFEKKIVWNKNRKLDTIDFKGLNENKNSPYVIHNQISYRLEKTKLLGSKIKVSVDAIFMNEKSFLHNGKIEYLNIAQLHFDVTELYKRKLLHKFVNSGYSKDQLFENHNSIYAEIWNEYSTKRNVIAEEINLKIDSIEKWKNWVMIELEKYPSQNSRTQKF